MDDENNNDDELAPMVDGLSGALCVLILITTVFMLSATDTIISGVSGYGFKFNYSQIDLENRKISFDGGINISHQALYEVRRNVEQLEDPTIYVYIPEYIFNREQKMVFNASEFKKKLNSEKQLRIKAGSGDICGHLTACVYWRE